MRWKYKNQTTPPNIAPRLLSESCTAAAHNLALADQLGAELGPIKRQVDVEVHTVKGTLRCVHALKVLLQVLARQIRGESNDLLDPC